MVSTRCLLGSGSVVQRSGYSELHRYAQLSALIQAPPPCTSISGLRILGATELSTVYTYLEIEDDLIPGPRHRGVGPVVHGAGAVIAEGEGVVGQGAAEEGGRLAGQAFRHPSKGGLDSKV